MRPVSASLFVSRRFPDVCGGGYKNTLLLPLRLCLCKCRATTHTDILIRAQDLGIETHVVHNASIMNAAGCSGLQLYSFGATISIPYFTETWRPDSFYDKIVYNAGGGMHTLCLLGKGHMDDGAKRVYLFLNKWPRRQLATASLQRGCGVHLRVRERERDVDACGSCPLTRALFLARYFLSLQI